jgi:hypothetical protein
MRFWTVVAALLALASAAPFADDWSVAEARSHVEAAEDTTLLSATEPLSFPDPGRDTGRRARRQERKPPRPRKPPAAGGTLVATARRRNLSSEQRASIRAAAAPLVSQLETELAALKSALRGPDPEFACRVAFDARATIPRAIGQFAAALHSNLPHA